MIRHLVLVRFASGTPETEITAVFTALDQLRTVVPGMGAFSGGVNTSPEGLGRGYTHAFSIDFDGIAARDAYLVHPQHKEAGARLIAATDGGVDGLLVFDLPVSSAS